MTTEKGIRITIENTINAGVEKVWNFYTDPQHIKQWNNASADWHTTFAENDLRVGGKFLSRMEAKDGSFGFDFWGIYDKVEIHQQIEYTMGDGRNAEITFVSNNDKTKVLITFDAELENTVELQRGGWQAILDNFKAHTESF